MPAQQGMVRLKPNKLLLFLAVLGPGIITAFVDNDAGGITTYSVAGASYGYSILWTLIPITVLLFIVQEMAARMGTVTGKGLSDLIRESFGLKLTFFIMIGLIIANFATITAEFAGIAAAAELFGLSKYIAVPASALLVYLLIVKIDYGRLEKVFFVICLFYIAYIISGFMAGPDWAIVGKELVSPSFSFDSSYLIIIIGVIGTTITPWMQFYLQSSIVEKGVKVEDYKYSRIEVLLGAFVTDIISFFIIIACAATLFANGVKVETASEAAQALAPFAGSLAESLFALGLLMASLFGAFVIPLATAYYLCEAFGWESGVNKKMAQAPHFYTLLLFLIIAGSLVVLIPGLSLVTLMLTAEVINGIILPVILIAMLRIINNKRIMGRYVNGRAYNIFCWTSIAILIALTLVLVISTLF
jgi:NRAMP (natural resistance-associated macrophage protein)-like metal ion transporter